VAEPTLRQYARGAAALIDGLGARAAETFIRGGHR
jgi:hypothetical protein